MCSLGGPTGDKVGLAKAKAPSWHDLKPSYSPYASYSSLSERGPSGVKEPSPLRTVGQGTTAHEADSSPDFLLLLEGMEAHTSGSYLGLGFYFENLPVARQCCLHTRSDMQVGPQNWEKNVGKQARVYPLRDYDAEEREHYQHSRIYQHSRLYHPRVERHLDGFNPLPLKTWSPPLHEKDFDDQDAGFGSSFWPFARMKRDFGEREERREFWPFSFEKKKRDLVEREERHVQPLVAARDLVGREECHIRQLVAARANKQRKKQERRERRERHKQLMEAAEQQEWNRQAAWAAYYKRHPAVGSQRQDAVWGTGLFAGEGDKVDGRERGDKVEGRKRRKGTERGTASLIR
jgi:hypothetical protein